MNFEKAIPAVFSIAILIFSTGIFAQEHEEKGPDLAGQHFGKGVELYNSGNYEAALAEFLESYRLKPIWQVKYNVAVCYKATNRYKKSLQEFHGYLEEGGEKIPAEKRDNVKKMMKEVEGKLGKLIFCCNLGRIEVIINDVDTFEISSGQEIYLDTGLHKVEVRKKGFKNFVDKVVVVSGKTEKIVVKLEPLPTEKVPAEKAEAAEKGKEKKKKIMKQRKREPLWLWIGLGSGGALAAGAVVSGIVVLRKKQKMENEVDICPITMQRGDCPKAYDYLDEARGWKLACNLLIAGAVVTAGTGLAMYFIGWNPRKKKADKKKVSWNVSFYPNAGFNLKINL